MKSKKIINVNVAFCEKCNRGIIVNTYRDYIDDYLKCEKCGNTREIKFNCNLDVTNTKRYRAYLKEGI